MLKLALGTFVIFFVLFVMVIILKRSKSTEEDFMFDFRSFEPEELERLKGKGLMSEDEAKKVQLVISDRATEWTEHRKKELNDSPVDINTLLSEADGYRRSFEKSKAEEEGPEEDPKE